MPFLMEGLGLVRLGQSRPGRQPFWLEIIGPTIRLRHARYKTELNHPEDSLTPEPFDLGQEIK
jgi:hypothetical protein